MFLVTRKHLAKNVVNGFGDQLHNCGTMGLSDYILSAKRGILAELKLLGSEPDPDEVDVIIGNKSWTTIICDECNEPVDEAVDVGENRDYNSATALVCQSCLVKAVELVKKSSHSSGDL